MEPSVRLVVAKQAEVIARMASGGLVGGCVPAKKPEELGDFTKEHGDYMGTYS